MLVGGDLGPGMGCEEVLLAPLAFSWWQASLGMWSFGFAGGVACAVCGSGLAGCGGHSCVEVFVDSAEVPGEWEAPGVSPVHVGWVLGGDRDQQCWELPCLVLGRRWGRLPSGLSVRPIWPEEAGAGEPWGWFLVEPGAAGGRAVVCQGARGSCV